MSESILMAHFSELCSAVGDVEQVRLCVFQLAVRGRLVPQHPADRPASDLVVIAKELKASSKKRRKVAPVENQVVPYAIPPGWAWTSFSETGLISPRNEAPAEREASFVPMPLVPTRFEQPVETEVRQWGAIKKGYTHFAEGDVVAAKITPCFQNRKSAVMRGLTNGIGAGTTELHVYRPFDGVVLPEYALLFLKTPGFVEAGIPKMTGTAGQKRVPKDYFCHQPFPLPPLGEQARIVAQAKRLLVLCDEFESEQNKKCRSRARFGEACLDRLLAVHGDQEFDEHWHRMRENFDLVAATLSDVAAIRRATYDLAIRGKFGSGVRELTTTTADLLAGIAEDKAALVAAKRLKRARSNKHHAAADPFVLPVNWAWARLDEICTVVTDGDHQAPPKSEDGVPFLTIGNVSSGELDFSDTRFVPQEYFESLDWSKRPQRGDVLYTVVGYSLGLAIEVESDRPFCVQRHIGILKPGPGISATYLQYALNTRFAYGQAVECATGSAQKTVPLRGLRGMLLPVPPSPVQDELVERLNMFSAQTDALAAAIERRAVTASSLLAAIAHSLARPPLTVSTASTKQTRRVASSPANDRGDLLGAYE